MISWLKINWFWHLSPKTNHLLWLFHKSENNPALTNGIISLPRGVGIKPIGHFIIIILGTTNWSKSTFEQILMICRHYSHIQILNTKRILNFLGVWVLVGLSLHVQFLCVFIGMRWNITKQGFMLALSGQRIVAIQNLKLYVVLIITKSAVVQWWDTFSIFKSLPFLVLWLGN
jgi:hypothetical protein